MKGATAFSTFGVTAVVIGIVVGLGLRTGAQNLDQIGMPTEANIQVVGILRGETARLHVVNYSSNTTEPFHRFFMMFIDPRGVLIKPEEVCDVRPGEICSTNLRTVECALPGNIQRCEFRALVVPEPMSCVPGPTADGGVTSSDTKWSANLEIIGRTGASRYTTGPNSVMVISTAICAPGGGTDGGGFFEGGAPAPDGGGLFDGGGTFTDGGIFIG